MAKLKRHELHYTKKISEEDLQKTSKEHPVCTDCKTVVLNPATCERCADGHGDIAPLCEGCGFFDEYYGTVCDHCHGYLLENK